MHSRHISFDNFMRAVRVGDMNILQQYIAENSGNPGAINAADECGNTALICAAANGHTVAMQALLTAGANVNAANQFGNTALICAAANGHTVAMQALLTAGANVNAAGQFGYTALICAAANGHTDAVQDLLAVPGIDLNARNNDHYTAAGMAESGMHNSPAHREIYNLIIAAIRARRAPGATVAVTATTSPAATPAIVIGVSFDNFIQAARDGNMAILQQYIAENSDNPGAINRRNPFDDSALVYAAYYGHDAVVTALLAISGIDVNAASEYVGNTALIWATINDHTAAVQALLAIPSINVNAASVEGNTALIWAAYHGHTAVVTALLAVPGIDLDAQNDNHRTAAGVAESRMHDSPAHREIYNLIIAAIRARRVLGATVAAAAATPVITPLAIGVLLADCQQAVRVGNLATVQLFIRANRDNPAALNAVDANGDTLLILAAMHGRARIVEELIRLPGLDITSLNNNNRSAAAEAQYNGYIAIAVLLTTLVARREHDHMPANEQALTTNTQPMDVQASPAALSFEERLAAIGFDEANIPPEFIDPISRGVINDPIVVKSGITYDRQSLTSYFASQGNPTEIHCPATRFYIGRDELSFNTSNTIVKMIERFVSKQEAKYKQRQEQEKAAIIPAAAAASDSSAVSENSPKKEAIPDAEKMRNARLKLFDAPASHSTSLLAADDSNTLAMNRS